MNPAASTLAFAGARRMLLPGLRLHLHVPRECDAVLSRIVWGEHVIDFQYAHQTPHVYSTAHHSAKHKQLAYRTIRTSSALHTQITIRYSRILS